MQNKRREGKLKKISQFKEIGAVLHHIPCIQVQQGKKYMSFHGEDVYTTKLSERILRLPLFYKMQNLEIEYVIEKVKNYF